MDTSHFSKYEDTDKEKVEGEYVYQHRNIKIYTRSIHSPIVIALEHIDPGEKEVVNSTGKMLVKKLSNYRAKS